MILDTPRAALGSETNTNLDVHSRSGRGLQICRSRARARAQARTQSCSRRPSKPQVTGQLQLQLSFSCVRVCTVAQLGNCNAQDKRSTPNYAAGGAAVAIRCNASAFTFAFEAAELLPASRLAVHVRVRFQTRNHEITAHSTLRALCTVHLRSVHPEILGIGIV